MKKEPKLSEKDQLILGYEKRIKHKKKQLSKTIKFHRGVEKELARKLKLDQIQLSALKKK